MSESAQNSKSAQDSAVTQGAAKAPVVIVSWLWVGLPFAWGVYELVLKAKNLFSG